MPGGGSRVAVGAAQRAAAWCGSAALRPSRVEHVVDGVLGHLAVGRQLAAGRRVTTPLVAAAHAVAARQVGGAARRRRLHERPQPGPRAGDVVGGDAGR